MSALLPVYALCRHRIDRDGSGVVTLVAVNGCPLRCKFCLNPTARDGTADARLYTPEALYAALAIDDLYFQATNGGVTFGGGEPLMLDGKLIGGLGVSGGSEEQDTGLAAFGSSVLCEEAKKCLQ